MYNKVNSFYNFVPVQNVYFKNDCLCGQVPAMSMTMYDGYEEYLCSDCLDKYLKDLRENFDTILEEEKKIYDPAGDIYGKPVYKKRK